MAEADYLKYDAAQAPLPFRKADTGDTLPAARLPAATVSAPGSISAADQTKLNGIEAGATADQSASEVPFTPTGSISATNVQAAIAEVAAEAGTGAGNVTGPGTATEDNIATYGNSPTLIKDGGTKISTLTAATSTAQSAANTAQSEIDAHEASAAPHSGHEQTANRNAANGYAGLSSSLLAAAQLPDATTSVKGAISAANQAKLDGISVGAAALTSAAPSQVGTSNAVGTGTTAARTDHVHAHGDLSGGSLHSAAGGGVAGFMTGADKTKLDTVTAGAQPNAATSLGTGGSAVYKSTTGAGVHEFRQIGGTLSPTSTTISNDGDSIYVAVANAGIETNHLKTSSVTTAKINDGAVTVDKLASLAVTEAKIVDGSVTNAKRANMAQATISGRAALVGTGVPTDLSPTQVRHVANVQAASGALAFRVPFRARTQSRIQRSRRSGKWKAGISPITELLNTHGTLGHFYPFTTFAAIDSNGHPHMDHDRLDNAGGPDLVTNVEAQADVAGFAKFIYPGGGSWSAAGYQVGKQVRSMGFTNAGTNNYFEVSAIGGAGNSELTVIDHIDAITSETASTEQEVRGTGNQSSGFNGYLEGLFIAGSTLWNEESFQFYSSGFMANTLNADCFAEFCLEPNPVAGVYNGANRIRMLTGQVGATWTGSLPFQWWCKVVRGYADDEYLVEWHLKLAGLLDERGASHVTGGQDSNVDAVWSPRFRVSRIAELDLYTATYQNAGVSLEMQRYEAGA